MSSVSVILPTYNSGRFVAEAIDSVLAQTVAPTQIIIVNDGSTDDTASVVRTYRDPRIVYLEQDNRGISAARNRGLALATGEYVTFLDADDRWRPTMVEKQVAILEAEPLLVCTLANFVRFEQTGGPLPRDQFSYYPLDEISCVPGPTPESVIVDGDAFCTLVGFHEIPCFMPATTIRAGLMTGMRFNEELHMGEDYEFALRLYLRGKVAFNRRPLADIRRHDANITKDYHYSPVYKLLALQSLVNYVSSEVQRAALRDRTIKAHIDAACLLSARGQLRTALSVFKDGLGISGSRMRKIKGAANLALTALRATVTAR